MAAALDNAVLAPKANRLTRCLPNKTVNFAFSFSFGQARAREEEEKRPTRRGVRFTGSARARLMDFDRPVLVESPQAHICAAICLACLSGDANRAPDRRRLSCARCGCCLFPRIARRQIHILGAARMAPKPSSSGPSLSSASTSTRERCQPTSLRRNKNQTHQVG